MLKPYLVATNELDEFLTKLSPVGTVVSIVPRRWEKVPSSFHKGSRDSEVTVTGWLIVVDK